MIEQYRDELITSLQGSVDEHRVAEDREAVASDLLNILHRCVGGGAFDSFYGAVVFFTYVLITSAPAQHPDPVNRDERTLFGGWRRSPRFWFCRGRCVLTTVLLVLRINRCTRSDSLPPLCWTRCGRRRLPPLRRRAPMRTSVSFLSFSHLTFVSPPSIFRSPLLSPCYLFFFSRSTA